MSDTVKAAIEEREEAKRPKKVVVKKTKKVVVKDWEMPTP